MKSEKHPFHIHKHVLQDEQLPPYIWQTRSPYSSNLQLAFTSIKWLFLSFFGFVIACLVAAVLQAEEIVYLLFQLALPCLTPLAVMTLCIASIASVLESLK